MFLSLWPIDVQLKKLKEEEKPQEEGTCKIHELLFCRSLISKTSPSSYECLGNTQFKF